MGGTGKKSFIERKRRQLALEGIEFKTSLGNFQGA